jgi:hypothetical protein
MLRFLCFFSLMLSLSSCVSDQEVVSSEQYFDLPKFIENEIIELNKNKTQLYKKVFTDGEYDSILIIKPDWKKELQIFSNININKPAFIGKYKITKGNAKEFQQTSYHSLDETLRIKSITLLMLNDSIKKISIFKDDHSMFLDNSICLDYSPGKSYHIKGYRNLLGVKTNYEIWAELR